MHPLPDYSRYNLEQLYDVLRSIDRERFPDRLELIRGEIERKGGDPFKVQPPVFFVPPWELTPALKAVRWIVGLEYGIVLAALPFTLVGTSSDEALMNCIIGSLFVLTYTFFCGLGIAKMRSALQHEQPYSEVEIGWLSAVGLAPISTILYTCISVAIIERLNTYDFFPVLFVVPASFYLPFVLLTYFVKYRCRDDEF